MNRLFATFAIVVGILASTGAYADAGPGKDDDDAKDDPPIWTNLNEEQKLTFLEENESLKNATDVYGYCEGSPRGRFATSKVNGAFIVASSSDNDKNFRPTYRVCNSSTTEWVKVIGKNISDVNKNIRPQSCIDVVNAIEIQVRPTSKDGLAYGFYCNINFSLGAAN